MGLDSPIMGIFYAVAAGVVLYLWTSDYKQGREGKGAFPGATPVPVRVLWIAGIGGLILTLLETAGEWMLGLTAEQTELAAIAILPLMSAAIIEEIIFRGYLVVDKKGKAWLVGSVLFFSVIFALIHPYLWNWEEGRLHLDLSVKAIFSTAFVFFSSLWFYAVRFSFGNHRNSLLPCFVAHATANFSVYIVKATQGYVTFP